MTEVYIETDTLPNFDIADNQEIINFFKLKPELKDLYESDSGVWQGYSLEEHTLLMMRQFDRYFADDFSSPLISKGVFRVMLALHDIGKPFAVKLFGKDEGRRRQHTHTSEIMPRALGGMELSPEEVGLISKIPTQDIMGKFIRGRIDVTKAAEEFKKGAFELGITNQEAFFDLIYVYYMSDAGSYTHDADPEMEEPPLDREHLDHLFNFHRKPGKEKGKLELRSDLKERVEELRFQISNS